MANYRIYVLDGGLEPVPAGVVGELYIAGVGLARGYLNRAGADGGAVCRRPVRRGGQPDVPDRGPGAVAVGRGAGVLGRADAQVKLRGFRIEPGEIEAALAGAGRRVAGRRDRAAGRCGRQRLVGYVVAAAGAALDAGGAAGGAVAAAAGLHGAVGAGGAGAAAADAERQARPPGAAGAGAWCSALRIGAPRTPQEAILCALFAEVLGVERVGVDDNFFELRRPLAAGDAADQPDPGDAERRGGDPQPVRGAERGGAGGAAASAGGGGAAAAGGGAAAACRDCRCPMRSGGCGSWTGWRASSAATYVIPLAVRLRGHAGPRGAGGRRWAIWSSGTRACGRCSRSGSGCRGRRSWRRRRRGRGLRSSAVERGRACGGAVGGGRAGLRSVARAAAAGASVRACRRRARAAAGAAPHRRRRLVARPAVRGTWRRCTGRGARAMRRGCRRCRCSTPTTRCGSRRCWATRTTRRARWRGSCRSGREALAGPAGADRAAGRPAAAGGVEPPRRPACRCSFGADLHRGLLRAGARDRREPVHGAAGRAGRRC